VFGRSKFQGYVIGRREDESMRYRELDDPMSLVHPYRVALAPGERHVQAIEWLATMPMVRSNRVELVIDGEAIFRSLFDGIAAAREFVLVQFYIVPGYPASLCRPITTWFSAL
jgi:cardiolipin synthase